MQKTATCRSGFLSLRTLVALLFCATITCFIVIPTGSGLAFLRPEKPSNASQRTLTFEERVSYQLGNHIIPHALGQRGQQKISQRTSYAPSHADGGAWTVTGSLNTGRFLHTVTSLPNGMVLVAGGLDNNFHATASTELYDPGSGTWTVTGNLNTARYAHTATLFSNGMVLAAGGVEDGGAASVTAELYDSANGTWTATGNLTTGRFGHTATLLSNGT